MVSLSKQFGRLIEDQGETITPKAVMAEFARLVYLTAYLKTHFPEEFTRAALRVAANDNL